MWEQIYLRHSVRIKRGNEVHRIHARRDYFHNGPCYDFVLVHHVGEEDADPWLARILAIMQVNVPPQEGVTTPGWMPFALVHWLERLPAHDIGTIQAFQFVSSPHPDAINLDAVERPVRLATSPRVGAHQNHVYYAMPYGKSARANAL